MVAMIMVVPSNKVVEGTQLQVIGAPMLQKENEKHRLYGHNKPIICYTGQPNSLLLSRIWSFYYY